MAAAGDPRLARIAESAPQEISADAASSEPAPSASSSTTVAGDALAAPARPAAAAKAQALPQAKSVRISLEWLDRMMNAVGELVINRTRMLGRLSELSKLVEVLQFSKARLTGKVSDFQEKHEFSRVRPTLMPGSHAPQMDTFQGHRALPGVTSNDLLDFSELEM